jgi:hypothetical protein
MKNTIKPLTYIDTISVLDLKYNIKAVQEDDIVKDLEGNTITLPEDIEEKRQELVQEYNAALYQKLRKLEYPSIEEYIDGVVKGDQDQIDAYIQKCLAVKTKYPKPNTN